LRNGCTIITEHMAKQAYCCVVIALVLSIPLLQAQTRTGEITGLVRDNNRVPLKSAEVVATLENTSEESPVLTNSHGIYRIPGLQSGSYTVDISAPGFKTVTQRHVVVEANRTVSIDIDLEQGGGQLKPLPPPNTWMNLVLGAVVLGIISLIVSRIPAFPAKIKTFVWRHIVPYLPRRFALAGYKRHVFSGLAFIENPVGPNLRVPLETAFAPLALLGKSDDRIELFSFASEHVRFIVLGGPGTGKTTIMKSLVINILSGSCDPSLNRKVPVFLELRSLSKANFSVEEAVVASFDFYQFAKAADFVKTSLNAGKLVIVLDGLDEVGTDRPKVAQAIRDFCKADNLRDHPNHVIVTCRESSYQTEDLRDVIAEVLRVEPFANHHIRSFLKGWPPHRDRFALGLLQEINADSDIRDICRNPLMLTILTGLYLDKENFRLPTSRNSFYEQALKELMEDRPGRRGFVQLFRSDDKYQILQRVALRRLEGTTSPDDPELFDKAAIHAAAADVLQMDAKDVKTNDLIDELVRTNGILKQSRDDFYTLNHRTFQEYLAAKESRRTLEPQEAIKLFRPRQELHEVFCMYCGLLDNIPQLNQVLERLSQDGRWLLAGRCLLNMSQVPSEAVIAQVVEGVFAENTREQRPLVLELLASLSQRSHKAFDPARRRFNDALDEITAQSSQQSVTGLVSSLARSPEVAARIVKGLLLSPNLEVRRAAVQILRDLDWIDELIKLLSASQRVERSDAAFLLAGMATTRREELIAYENLFPHFRSAANIWPLDDVLPTKVAVPIVEALPPDRRTGVQAMDFAAQYLHGPMEPKATSQWLHLKRDLKIRKLRVRCGALVIKISSIFLLVLMLTPLPIAWFLMARHDAVLIQDKRPYISSFSQTPIADLNQSARDLLDELRSSYPPSSWRDRLRRKLGIAVEPAVPSDEGPFVSMLSGLSPGLLEQRYNLYNLPVDIKTSLQLSPSKLASFKHSRANLRKELPILSGRRYVVIYASSGTALTITGIIVLVLTFFLTTLRVPKLRGGLSELSGALDDYNHALVPVCGFAAWAILGFGNLAHNWLFGMTVTVITVGWLSKSTSLKPLSWPRNQFYGAVDQFSSRRSVADATLTDEREDISTEGLLRGAFAPRGGRQKFRPKSGA